MIVAFSIAFIACLYFIDMYGKEKKKRFVDGLQREIDASDKEIARLIALSVAADIAQGKSIEEAADRHASLHHDIESLRRGE